MKKLHNSQSLRRIPLAHRVACLLLAFLLMAVTTPISPAMADAAAKATVVPSEPTVDVKARTGLHQLKRIESRLIFSKSPTDIEITSARIFPEPLVPMSTSPVQGENGALSDALVQLKKTPDNFTPIESFITTYPKSRWVPSIELNLGLANFREGRLTDAIKYWESVWERAKDEGGRQQKAVADRAIARLLIVYARLGKQKELKEYLAQLKDRPFFGSDEELVKGAREGLWYMENKPQCSFKCGPYAVETILGLNRKASVSSEVIKNASSTSQGTNLFQVKQWADQVGLKYQMAKRSKGAPVLVPAVMHWTVGHFATITGLNKNGRYLIKDPTFDTDATIGLTTKTLDAETDGYFLVPAGQLPSGWEPVSEEEGRRVWGKGVATSRQDNNMLPNAPVQCNVGCKCDAKGMARADAWSMNATLHIVDTPLSYHPPIGPDVEFRLNYNHLETNQPATFTFTNFGPDWTIKYVSYLTVDSGTQVATVRVSGGGSEVYTPDLSGNYSPDLITQALLVKIGTNNYQRQLPDGSIEVFDQPDGTGNIFMTKMQDPQGNSTLVQYDSNFRATTITDPVNQVSTITYLSNSVGNPGFYKVASIQDPFGRTCSFSYDSTTTSIIAITDVIGLVSSFLYDTSASFITLMTTPYGQTSFYAYVPGIDVYPARGLRFGFPDGTSAVIENWINEVRQTFYWDREATMLYPGDPAAKIYSHAQSTGWLIEKNTQLETAVVNFKIPPLEPNGKVQYFYKDGTPDRVGEINKPIQIHKFIGNEVVTSTIGGTITAGDTVQIVVVDPLGVMPNQTCVYTVQAGDTLNSVAAGLAAAVNANGPVQTLGLFATSQGPTITLSSAEVVSDDAHTTRYFPSTSVGATETIDLKGHTKQIETVTVGGTITPGNTPGIKFSTQMPQHDENVFYTVQSGDTLSTVAAGFAAQINANSFLQGYGTVATSSGPDIRITTFLPGNVAYNPLTLGTISLSFALGANGSNQNYFAEYNDIGKMTKSIDPVGRTFTYQYDTNKIDLLQITETQDSDNFLIGSWAYNSQHRPLSHTDGSGRTWNFTYNSSGQLLTSTDPNSKTTSMTYTGTAAATVGGTVTAGDVLSITVHDVGLAGGQKTVSYTVLAGNTLNNIATGLKNAVNADTNLQAIGVTATSSGAVVTLKSTSVNVTSYTGSTSGGATETLAVGANVFGFLTKINGPLTGGQDVTTMSYDSVGRLSKQTDSEGYQLTFSYDNADRLTKTTYPDATTEQTIYNKLDAILKKDRNGRWSTSSFDSLDQLAFEMDPLGRKTQYSWCACGSLAGLTDPDGKTTSWQHDLQGRPILKTYADQTTVSYVYENATSRLRKQTDAKNQSKIFFYNVDDTNYQVGYKNAQNPTGTVSTFWDSDFKRMTSNAKNDWGTISYTYKPYIAPGGSPSNGGGRLQLVHNDVIPNSDISYVYDKLGRTTNRSINGATNSIDWTYDAMSRVTDETNALGNFAYAYVDDTPGSSKGTTRLASITYPNSQVTNFNWYPNIGDQRLQQIINRNPGGAVLSQFDYGYNPAGEITQWQQQQNGNNLFYNLGYDLAGQLTTAQAGSGSPLPPYESEFYYGYDKSSNRTSVQTANSQNVRIGGTVTIGDTVTVTVLNSTLSGGQKAVSYSVVSGDTLTRIASRLAAIVTADTSLQALGVSAVNSGSLMTIRSITANPTNYTLSTSAGATETMAFAIFKNGIENASIGGSKTTGDTLTLTVFDQALAGGQKSVNYVVLAGDTLTSIATGIASAINADTSLQAIGVTATSASTVVSVASTSVNPTTYTQSTSAGATETITLTANTNIPALAAIGGSVTTGDVLTITFFDPAISGGSKAINYTTVGGDTLTTIATALKNAINADTSLQGAGISATSAQAIVTITSKSTNSTAYRQTVSAGATEIIAITTQPNALVTATVAGARTAGDVVTLTVFDAALPGGQQAPAYTVQAGDSLNAVATGLSAAVNANTNLQALGVTASASRAVVTVSSASPDLTTYKTSVSAGATETLTLSPGVGVLQSAYNNVNELVSITPGGGTRFQGVTNKGVKSASIGTQVIAVSATPPEPTNYAQLTSPSATEIITLGTNINGNSSATLSGTVTTNDVLTLTVLNANLSGGETDLPYTVQSGDSLTSIAASFASAVNANTGLQAIGLGASSAGAIVTLTITGTTYTSSTSGGATEIISLGTNVAGNTVVSITGKATSGDALTITVHNPSLSGGQKAVTYNVTGTDTLVTIAAGMAAAINADTSLQALGITATNTSAATLAFAQAFAGDAPLPAGLSTANVSAVDGASNTRTNSYQVGVASQASSALTYDQNGNMTSDGTNSYSWDAENRLVRVTYPGTNNFTDFTFDGLGRNVKIVETTSGSVTSTKQYVWCVDRKRPYQSCEERDASGVLNKKYYSMGQMNASSKYFYCKSNDRSTRELLDNSGVVQAEYSFDLFGQLTRISESVPSDVQYCGYFLHARSGLNLTRTRTYSPSLGRWMSRDPIGEMLNSAGVNLYEYAYNSPVVWIDPDGLGPLGAGIGAEVGGALGGALGGLGGAAGGTAVEPGGGTILGGLLGAGEGGELGATVGAGIGSAVEDAARAGALAGGLWAASGAGRGGAGAGAGTGTGAIDCNPDPCRPGRAQFKDLEECYASCDKNCPNDGSLLGAIANTACKAWCVTGRGIGVDPPLPKRK